MKRAFLFIAILAASLVFTGCGASSNQTIDFGTEVINDLVSWDEFSNAPNDNVRIRNMLNHYEADHHKQIYCIGTKHECYFDKDLGYSIADFYHTIDIIAPDYILIEARNENLTKYGAVDGPIEMEFVCGYGMDRGIPVIGIDYWEEGNDFAEIRGTTFDERDNQMFYQIYAAVQKAKKNSTILVVFGGAHYYNQQPRMEKAGWTPVPIEDRDHFFEKATGTFTYPASMEEIFQKKEAFFANIYPDILKSKVTDAEDLALLNEMAEEKLEATIIERRMVEQNCMYPRDMKE